MKFEELHNKVPLSPSPENFIQRDSLETRRVRLREQESVETIRHSMENVAEGLVEQYPQVNSDGQLVYYIGGSFGTMLLRAGKIEALDNARLPEIHISEERIITLQAQDHFKQYTRKIGDVDYVPVISEAWQESAILATKRLPKGAPEATQKVFRKSKLERDNGNVGFEKLKSVTKRPVRITIEDKTFYIEDPKQIFAYKCQAASMHLNKPDEIDEYTNDFEALHGGVQNLYSQQEIIAELREVLFEPNQYGHINNIQIPYYQPTFTDEMRQVFDAVIESDEDIAYLHQISCDREKSIAILRILHRFSEPAEKQILVEFLNDHSENINGWELDSTDRANCERMADFLINNDIEVFWRRDVRKGTINMYKEFNRENLIQYLDGGFGKEFEAFGTRMQQEFPESKTGKYKKVPVQSELLDKLYLLDTSSDLAGQLRNLHNDIMTGRKEYSEHKLTLSDDRITVEEPSSGRQEVIAFENIEGIVDADKRWFPLFMKRYFPHYAYTEESLIFWGGDDRFDEYLYILNKNGSPIVVNTKALAPEIPHKFLTQAQVRGIQVKKQE